PASPPSRAPATASGTTPAPARSTSPDTTGRSTSTRASRYPAEPSQNEPVHVLPFLVVGIVVVVTPGVDMALVTKNALVHGRDAAVATALGINTGIALWTVAAALGLAAIVRESADAF